MAEGAPAVERGVRWQSWLGFLDVGALSAETTGAEVWKDWWLETRRGSRARTRRRQVEKSLFGELLDAIAAGFSSEMGNKTSD